MQLTKNNETYPHKVELQSVWIVMQSLKGDTGSCTINVCGSKEIADWIANALNSHEDGELFDVWVEERTLISESKE